MNDNDDNGIFRKKNRSVNATLVYKTLNGFVTHFKVKCNLQNDSHDRYLLGNKRLESLRYNETLVRPWGVHQHLVQRKLPFTKRRLRDRKY